MRSEESYEAILTDQEMAILATQQGLDDTILEMGENSLLRSELEVQLLLNNQKKFEGLHQKSKVVKRSLCVNYETFQVGFVVNRSLPLREVSQAISGNNFSLKVNVRSMGEIQGS